MPEYKKYRCCMCPNTHTQSLVCPPSPFGKGESECRYIKKYVDDRGWQYKVMSGLGEGNYKARYRKPGTTSWKGMRNVPWSKSFDDAQSELNRIAKEKNWKEYVCVDTQLK